MNNLFLVHVNYLSVLVCAVTAMVWGFLWYGPIFGKEWKEMGGLTPKNRNKTYGLMFLSSLVMAYVLAHFVWYAAPGSLTMLIAVKTAVWAWLGFVATVSLSKFLFSGEKKSWRLLLIDSGYYLAVLVTMGVVFGVMP